MSRTTPTNDHSTSAQEGRPNATTAAWAAQQEDSQLNPLTKKKFSDNYRKILSASRELPVTAQRQTFLDMYHNNKVTIVASESGSGSSTQIPKFVLYDQLAGNGRIAVTQPRRLAAAHVASRVAEELDVRLGGQVGYAMSLESMESEETRLRFCTDGLLLVEAQRDPGFRKYSCIIVDEVHERSMPTDILLMMLKTAVQERNDLRVVLMLATSQAAKFQAYFDGNTPILTVPGRQHSVKVRYLTEAACDAVEYAVMAALHVDKNMRPGDILIFLSGESDINRARTILEVSSTSLEVIPLYGALPKSQQARIYQGSGRRRCILSTSIAETSLTVPNIVYVIDSGLVKEMVWNPRVRMHEIRRATISKFSAEQRKDRAGRVADGECFRMYTMETHRDDFRPSTVPAIQKDRLESVILSLLATGNRDLLGLDFVSYPHPEPPASAIMELSDLGLIHSDDQTDETGKVTALAHSPTTKGSIAARFPIEPIMFSLLEAAVRFECLEEMTVIVAAAELQYPIWVRPADFEDAADRIGRPQFAHPLSDHITDLNAIQAFVHVYKDKKMDAEQWCHENFLSHTSLLAAVNMRTRLCELVTEIWPGKLNIHPGSVRDPEYADRIRKALAVGLATQSAVHKKDTDSHVMVNHNHAGLISSQSAVLYKGYDLSNIMFVRGAQGFPAYEWIVYNDFVCAGGKCHFNTVTVIEPEWFCNEPFLSKERATKKFDGKLKQPEIQARIELARRSLADTAAITTSLAEITL